LKVLGGALAAVALVSAPALANPKNALDAYVAKPDPAFAWKVAGQVSGPGYHGAVLELTSQTWLTSKEKRSEKEGRKKIVDGLSQNGVGRELVKKVDKITGGQGNKLQ